MCLIEEEVRGRAEREWRERGKEGKESGVGKRMMIQDTSLSLAGNETEES